MADNRTPWIGVSQYQKQAFKDDLPKKEPCTFSRVLIDNKIKINDIEHPGTIVHRCSLLKGHKDEFCKCLCGYQFKGYEI